MTQNNILFLTFFDIFEKGGMGTFIRRIAYQLSKKNISGYIISNKSTKHTQTIGNFKIIYISPYRKGVFISNSLISTFITILREIMSILFRDLNRMFSLFSLFIKDNNIKIICVVGPPTITFSFFSIIPYWYFFKKIFSKKIVLIVRGIPVMQKNLGLLGQILYKFNYLEHITQMRLADKIVYVDDAMKKIYPKKFLKKALIIHNSVDTKMFYPKSKKILFDLLYVGRLSEDRGIWVFLKGVRILRKKYPNLRICIVGTGYLEKKVKEYIKEHNLGGNIELFSVPHNAMRDIYNKSLIIINPMLVEGIGNITLEAMSCGKCIIKSCYSSKDSIIKHKYNGILFKANDAKDLVRKIEEVIENKNLRKYCEKNARKTILKNYTPLKERDKYLSLFNGLV